MNAKALEAVPSGGSFVFDTTLVLFFLSLDLGQSAFDLGTDSLLSLATIAVLAVAPYFLPFEGERPSVAKWLIGRGAIAILGLAAGGLFYSTVGTVLPESMRFIPLTMLIVAAVFSCFIQFYGILKFRLAR